MKVLRPFIFTAFLQGVEIGLLQGSGDFTADDIFNESIKTALQQKTFEHATLAIGTTKDQLQNLLQKALENGDSVQQLAKEINDQYQVQSRVRSVRIARTEITDSINDGTTRTLTKEGYTHKEWSTVIDGRERASHASANGQTVPVQAPFSIGGQSAMYPGDDTLSAAERINCRCTVVGSGIPLDRSKELGKRFLLVHGQLEKKLVVQLEREFERQRRRILSHFPSA